MSLAPGALLRILAIVLVAVIALQFSTAVAAYIARTQDGGDPIPVAIYQQAGAAADLIESLPIAERDRAARALSSPMVTFDWRHRYDAINDAAFSEPRILPALAVNPGMVGWRPFSVYTRSAQGLAGLTPWSSIFDDIVIFIRLQDGSALEVLPQPSTRRHFMIQLFAVLSGALALTVVGLLIWTAYATSRPLTQMARAAESFSQNLSGPPMSETGPPAVRTLASAFNEMRAELARLVDERTNTLAAIAHDLRTYLTRLRMRAEFIEDESQRDRAVSDLEEMGRIIDDAVSLAGGGEKAPAEPVDLSALVQDLAAQRRETGAAVVAAARAPVYARVPATALRRAAGNLIDNALRYAGAAEVCVEQSGDHAVIRVLDRGPGAPEAALERLAEPFFRVESSRSRETGGAGLGLAIVKAVAESAGGRLVLANRPRGGFEAALHLPASPAPDRSSETSAT